MASGLLDTVHGVRRTAARCAVFGVGLATLLAVLCVCFGSSTHHDERGARDVMSLAATPMPTPTAGGGGSAPAEGASPGRSSGPSTGHSCPPRDECASATHAAAIALPAPEPSVPTTLGEAGLSAPSLAAHPVPRAPVHRHAPDLHVLQVQRT
ncbi:hypothetical protein OG302_39795 [Streptomyces sp. NBC_01283]|uniref:hypothetical protein n=1 Tax=Streptomyces sp. NBC_01283 TaxID=2903812 RepID=UPI00352DC230|nr:hypothetical protein OG302_39795 [Streptomyces sp. NBC_01283]